jgi:hypothetical protein
MESPRGRMRSSVPGAMGVRAVMWRRLVARGWSGEVLVAGWWFWGFGGGGLAGIDEAGSMELGMVEGVL